VRACLKEIAKAPLAAVRFLMSHTVSWDDQRIFLAVLESGSLSAAARRLGLSHPTVRSRIEALEQALGTVLFVRSVNGVSPTETAIALHQAARTMALASDLFIRVASAPTNEIAGTVRLSVSELMGVEIVPPMLKRLRDRHPGLVVELSLSNIQADLLAHEVDVAVRTVAPQQDALVARKVASIPLGLFAAPDYIARRGEPRDLADLANHAMIGPDRNRSDLALAEARGAMFSRERFVLRSDSHPAQLAAVRAGIGIGVTQVHLGDNDPRLVRVLPDFTMMSLDTWIVMHENLSRVPRVRALFDALVEDFSAIR
jgi:DNA-binding transcriptional LysR family regulator